MNLADLPSEKREEIERSKKAFFKAKKMLSTMQRQAIKADLERMPEDERELLRYALNTIREKK